MKKIKIVMSILYVIIIGCVTMFLLSFLIDDINNYLIIGLMFLCGICIGVIIYSRSILKSRKKMEWLEDKVKLTNSIAYKVKKAGERCFTEIPIGIIVYNNKYVVEWANNFAKEVFKSSLVDRSFSIINKELEAKLKAMQEFNITIYGREYSVSSLRDDNIIFIVDRTEYRALEHKYNTNVKAVGIITLDNFEDALSNADAQEKALRLSDIIGILSNWCEKYDIYIKGYSEKQYLIIMTREQLERVMQEKFKVIEDVNLYCYEQGLKITISIGLACMDIGIVDLMKKSDELLELAQNRGGNQAAIQVDNEVKYYGGKEIGVDTRLPIYVRVKTEDLCELIEKSSNVIIMAHSNTDADAFGACVALDKIAKALNKESYVVVNEDVCDITVKNVYQEIITEHVGLMDTFIPSTKALSLMNDDTLLILADCQYENLLIDPKVYRKAKNIAIIDHHRSNKQAISNYNYLYNKTTSSSSVELIVEMFEYIDAEISVSSIEATLMLLGIIVDTNNLIYRTSAQTFAVLSKLQTYGAQMIKVQMFLREEQEVYESRVRILNDIEIIDDKYGIAICDEDEIYTRQFIAKIADGIIALDKLHAGFCIGRISKDSIAISARSFDQMNVQLVMEELNGGGHFNNAATQLKNKTMKEAKESLIKVLKNQGSVGEETMKIILIKDVKGKGKQGDIIDIPSGHANYLIRSKSAILATVDNLNDQKKKNEQEKIEAQKHLEEMKKLKEELESKEVEIEVRVGKEGKMFGTVSTKQIVDEIKTKYDITLDKRKILYDKEIDKIGTYSIPIQLHKEVTANIKLFVVEKK